MPVHLGFSSAFLQIPTSPVLSSPIVHSDITLPPPAYTPVDSPPDYTNIGHWLLIEIFHSLLFFPAAHPLLLSSDFVTSPLPFDSTLFCSIAFPPQYEPRSLSASESSAAVPSLAEPDAIVRYRQHPRAGRFTRRAP